MLIVENEAWSPFVFSFESTSSEREAANNPGDQLTPLVSNV
ncbi:hypothetical protein RchiOBHm_Chr3g0477011 [Rosa chinensis]|uniref:Uncharacterized protein n=1 Tax=Rosa chinensis TaxID=74649 RepID=A0A2P6RCT3_ROSCH|nr:hypothetical protein RchiOBHm_Chr3g0477011 [Rosa chinensis]